MTYWSEFPLVPRLPREPDAGQDRRLNLIAALAIALLAIGLALAPSAATAPSSDTKTASYGD